MGQGKKIHEGEESTSRSGGSLTFEAGSITIFFSPAVGESLLPERVEKRTVGRVRKGVLSVNRRKRRSWIGDLVANYTRLEPSV